MPSIPFQSQTQSSTQSNPNQSAHPIPVPGQPSTSQANQARIFQPNLSKPASTLDSIHDSVSFISRHASHGWNSLTSKARGVVVSLETAGSGVSGVGSTTNLNQNQLFNLESRNRSQNGNENGSRANQVEPFYDDFHNQPTSTSASGNQPLDSTTDKQLHPSSPSQDHLDQLANSKQAQLSQSSSLESIVWSTWIHLPNSILQFPPLSSSSSTSPSFTQSSSTKAPRGKTLCLFLSYPTSGLHVYALKGDQLVELLDLRDLRNAKGQRISSVLAVEVVRDGSYEEILNGSNNQQDGVRSMQGGGEKETVVEREGKQSAVEQDQVDDTTSNPSSTENERTSKGDFGKKKKRKEKSNGKNDEEQQGRRMEMIQAEKLQSESSSEDSSSHLSSKDSAFTPSPSINKENRTSPKGKKIGDQDDLSPSELSLEFQTPHLILITPSSNSSSVSVDETSLEISRYSLLSNKVFSTIPLGRIPLNSNSDHHHPRPHSTPINQKQSINLKKSSRFLVISQTLPPAIHILSVKSLLAAREPILDVNNLGPIEIDGFGSSRNQVFFRPPVFDLRDRILAYVSNGVEKPFKVQGDERRNGNGIQVMVAPTATASASNPDPSSSSSSPQHEHDLNEKMQRYSNINQAGHLGYATNQARNATDYARRMGGDLVSGIKGNLALGLGDWKRNLTSATGNVDIESGDDCETFLNQDGWENGQRHSSSFGQGQEKGTGRDSTDSFGKIMKDFSSSSSSPNSSGDKFLGKRSSQNPTSNSNRNREQTGSSSVKLIDLVSSTSTSFSSSSRSTTTSGSSKPTTNASSPLSTILSFNPRLSPSSPSPSVAIVSLAPSAAGAMLLLTADEDGRNADVWEWRNCGKMGDGTGSIWHRYRLHRGLTTSKITQINWSRNCQWLGIGTLKGTVHIYAINPFGGEPDLRNHLDAREIRGPMKSMPLSFEMNCVARTGRFQHDLSNGSHPAGSERKIQSSSHSNLDQGRGISQDSSIIKQIPTFVFLEDFPNDERARLWGLGPPPLTISDSSQDSFHQPKTILDVLVFHPETSTVELNRLICSSKVEIDGGRNFNGGDLKKNESFSSKNEKTKSARSFGKGFIPSLSNISHNSSENLEVSNPSSMGNGSGNTTSSTTNSNFAAPSRISGLTHMMRIASEGINQASNNLISSTSINWNSYSPQSISNSIGNSNLVVSPTRVAGNLLNASRDESKFSAQCSRIASWGPLARKTSSAKAAAAAAASNPRDLETSFSNIQSTLTRQERRALVGKLNLREKNRLERVQIQNGNDANGNGNGWVTLAEMTTFSKVKGIHLPSIYLSRQFNIAILRPGFEKGEEQEEGEEEGKEWILSQIHRRESTRLKVREEVKISSREDHANRGGDSSSQESENGGIGISTSFDLSLASAISANFNPKSHLDLQSLSPSARIPMFPQGKPAVGSNNWRSSVSNVTGGIPIRSVTEGINGGLEKARRGVGEVSRRRRISKREAAAAAAAAAASSSATTELSSNSLSFEDQEEDLNQELEIFNEARGKAKKDSGVSTSISPDKSVKGNRDRIHRDEEDAYDEGEEDLEDEDYLLARKNHQEVESWDSLEDQSWSYTGGDAGSKSKTSMSMQSLNRFGNPESNLTSDRHHDTKNESESHEEFTLGLFDEEVQSNMATTVKTNENRKEKVKLTETSLPPSFDGDLSATDHKRGLNYPTISTPSSSSSASSSSSSCKSAAILNPSSAGIANHQNLLNVQGGSKSSKTKKSKSKSKPGSNPNSNSNSNSNSSSSQDSNLGTSPLSLKSNKTGGSMN